VTTVAPTAAAIDAATPVVPRVAWRRVREGLTESEVQALIGPPTKVFELAGKTVWYYYYPSVGAGSVFFSSRGVASSVQRPSGGG
jgi:outer membrane protein assembly factor BamE (lipoprotein component of BamABCDE complex)